MSKDAASRIQKMEALLKLSRKLHGTLELRAAFDAILEEAIHQTRAQSGTICLLNPTTGFLEIEAALGFPKNALNLRLRIGEGVTGWVARRSRTVRIADVRSDPRYISVRPEVRSALTVPFRIGDDTVGVINLDADQPNAFTDEDQNIVEELAELASTSTQTSWIHQSARQKAHLLESLLRVGRIINSTLGRDEALTAITREARVLTKARVCSVMLLNDTGEWLEVRAHHGAGPRYLAQSRVSVADSFLGTVVRRRKPAQDDNIQHSGRYENPGLARAEKLVSLLSVPLVYDDIALGTLNLYTDKPHVFSDEEVRTLAAYAELSAVALEKARLYDGTVAVEGQLRESESLSALGLLAAEIAHEIRNPLTVMKMLHHSLNLEFPPDDARGTDVRIMGEKMDHLNRIVDQVLDFARRTEPMLGPVDVNQLLDDLTLLTRLKLRAHNVILDRRLDARLPRLHGDATQLEQVFLNLTLNAVEAMPEGGRLSIRSRALPLTARDGTFTHVLIRFRDTGIGMNEEQRKRLFTSLLSTSKPRGTGLGLAIVGRVIEQHQGIVRVKSSPGLGATFTLILPTKSRN